MINNKYFRLMPLLLVLSFAASIVGCRTYPDASRPLTIIPDYERFYFVDTIRIDNPFYFYVDGVDYVTNDTMGLRDANAEEIRKFVSNNNENEYYVMDEQEFYNFSYAKHKGSSDNLFSKFIKREGQRIPEYSYRTIGEGVVEITPKTKDDSTHMFILALMNIAVFNTWEGIDFKYQRRIKSINPYNYYFKIVFSIIITDSAAIPDDELNNLRVKQGRPITKSTRLLR